jgi:predicted transcriptional regulator
MPASADPPEEKWPAVVRDLMTVGVTTCPLGTLVGEIARLMVEKNLEAVVVLDEEGNARGYVGQDEVIAAISRPVSRDLKVDDILREDLPQVPVDIPIATAAQIMQDQGVRVLFFLHHAGGIAYPAGILTFRHILRFLAARSPEELRDLGIHAARQSPLEVFIQRRDAARKKNIKE